MYSVSKIIKYIFIIKFRNQLKLKVFFVCKIDYIIRFINIVLMIYPLGIEASFLFNETFYMCNNYRHKRI